MANRSSYGAPGQRSSGSSFAGMGMQGQAPPPQQSFQSFQQQQMPSQGLTRQPPQVMSYVGPPGVTQMVTPGMQMLTPSVSTPVGGSPPPMQQALFQSATPVYSPAPPQQFGSATQHFGSYRPTSGSVPPGQITQVMGAPTHVIAPQATQVVTESRPIAYSPPPQHQIVTRAEKYDSFQVQPSTPPKALVQEHIEVRQADIRQPSPRHPAPVWHFCEKCTQCPSCRALDARRSGGEPPRAEPPRQTYTQAPLPLQSSIQPAKAPAPAAPPTKVGLGMLLTQEGPGGAIWVEEVVPGLAADRSGKIKVGDFVTAIDGQNIASLDLAKQLSVGYEGTSVTVTGRRGAWPFTAQLQRFRPGAVPVGGNLLQQGSSSIYSSGGIRQESQQQYGQTTFL